MPYKDPEVGRRKKQEYHLRNREAINAKSRAWHHANKARVSQQHREAYLRDGERIRAKSSEYYRANKEIVRERGKRYYATHRDAFLAATGAYQAAHPEQYKEYRLRYVARVKSTPEGHVESLLKNARQRARRKHLPFNITLEDLLPVPSVCPVLGTPIVYGIASSRAGKATQQSPSIDRIDNQQGYVHGNVRVISHRANMLKSNGTPEELRLVAADATMMEARQCLKTPFSDESLPLLSAPSTTPELSGQPTGSEILTHPQPLSS